MPDSDHEIERTLLGMALHPDGGKHFLEGLTDDDWTDKRHRAIFHAIQKSPENDLVLIRSSMTPPPDDNLCYYLTGLALSCLSTANVETYRRELRRASNRRKAKKMGKQIGQAWVAGDDHGARELLSQLQSLSDLESDETAGLIPLRDIIPGVMDTIEAAYKAGGQNTGISSGLYDLDYYTSGWQPSDLIVLAGRPSMGKTALAMLFARKATDKGHNVGVFSLEMSSGQLVNRLLATESGINLLNLRSGRLTDDDWRKLGDAGGNLWNHKIFIDDRGGMSVLQIRDASLRLQRRAGLDLVIVDYLQLGTSIGENQNVRIAAMSAGLKALAKELNVPVILLSQLNRAVEGREKKRPTMSDLRDSGAIEQDADLILLLYRAAAYPDMATDGNQHEAEIIIAKQRNGPTGKVSLFFDAATASFSNLSRRE